MENLTMVNGNPDGNTNYNFYQSISGTKLKIPNIIESCGQQGITRPAHLMQ